MPLERLCTPRGGPAQAGHGRATGPTYTHTLQLGHHATRPGSSSEVYKGFSQQAEGPGSGKALHAEQGKHREEACRHQLLGTHAGTHMLTRMHARQYLLCPSWETQSSWLATLPSPRESKEKQERKPLGSQEGH